MPDAKTRIFVNLPDGSQFKFDTPNWYRDNDVLVIDEDRVPPTGERRAVVAMFCGVWAMRIVNQNEGS